MFKIISINRKGKQECFVKRTPVLAEKKADELADKGYKVIKIVKI